MVEALQTVSDDAQRLGHAPTGRLLVRQSGPFKAGDVSVTLSDRLIKADNPSVRSVIASLGGQSEHHLSNSLTKTGYLRHHAQK
jgi:hypothetical protein